MPLSSPRGSASMRRQRTIEPWFVCRNDEAVVEIYQATHSARLTRATFERRRDHHRPERNTIRRGRGQTGRQVLRRAWRYSQVAALAPDTVAHRSDHAGARRPAKFESHRGRAGELSLHAGRPAPQRTRRQGPGHDWRLRQDRTGVPVLATGGTNGSTMDDPTRGGRAGRARQVDKLCSRDPRQGRRGAADSIRLVVSPSDDRQDTLFPVYEIRGRLIANFRQCRRDFIVFVAAARTPPDTAVRWPALVIA